MAKKMVAQIQGKVAGQVQEPTMEIQAQGMLQGQQEEAPQQGVQEASAKQQAKLRKVVSQERLQAHGTAVCKRMLLCQQVFKKSKTDFCQ